MDTDGLGARKTDVAPLLVLVAPEFVLALPPAIRFDVETLAFEAVVVIVFVRPRIRTVSVGIR